MLARASLIFLLTLGVIIDGPFARATDAISLTPSASSVAPGQTVDLTAAMPVVAAGSTTQTLTQVIDPTKVKLTSASDITYPAGWTLSYSTDGTSFSSTAPTTTAGWAAVRAVRATGDLVSSGSSNGFQVASRTATGTASTPAPPAITTSGTGDGFEAFFDPGRTRVFNIFHNQPQGLSGQLDCYVLATDTRCSGFPMNFSSNATPKNAIGRVVGNRIWSPGYRGSTQPSEFGFHCIDISAVLASGGSPASCSTPFVSLASATNWGYSSYLATGVGTSGRTDETKLWSVVGSTGNLVCLDTNTRQACTGMPTGGWSTGLALAAWGTAGADIELWDNRIYIRGSINSNATSPGVACRQATNPNLTCDGWSSPAAMVANNNLVGKLFPLPNSAGQTEKMCLGPDGRQNVMSTTATVMLQPSSTAISCWDSSGAKTNGPAGLSALMTGLWSTETSLGYQINYSVIGTRIAWANGVNTTLTPSTETPGIACWDTALDGPCTTANLGTTTTANGSINYSAATGFSGTGAKNYTAVLDPIAPNCLWVTQHDAPRIFLLNVVDGTSNCSAGAPTKASFSGSAIVPRMACNSNQDAIRQWESFTLKTAGTGTFTSATLTVKNSSGVAISGWTDRAVSLNTPLDLSGLSPGSTGLTPSFEVAFGGISGSITTASAEVKVVGDSPELCTRVTAAYVCPTGSGPIGSLPNAVAAVSANGSSVLGGATTTLPQVDQSITVTAPALSTCTSSITGRAGDGGGGSSGTAISGVTVSLLDSSGNPVLVNGNPVTTTTASDGTYAFAGLLPNSYKVKFGNSQIAEVQSTTITSGGSGTTSRLPATSCTAGTSTLVENPAGDGLLNQITGASVLNRSTPGNLVVNGDFTSSPVTSGGSAVAIQSGQVDMRAAGRDDHRLPGWSFSGGGPNTYARWQNWGASTPDGASAGNFYFGNSWWLATPSFNSATAFSPGGVTQNSYVFRQDSSGNYGMTDANPVQISQTLSTDIGRTYRLQFWQASEPFGNNPGIAAFELTGYTRTYFKVNKTVPTWTRYTFDFVATSSSTTLSFKNWGHVGAVNSVGANPDSTDELRLDDVIVSRCGNADAEVNSGTTTISAGTGAVVNALYTIPATAAADTPAAGTQGSAQTINVLSNDSAASGATLTASTVRFCGLSPAQTPPSCSQTTLTTADGSYSINTSTGVVTFTPNASFTGTATQPPTYQVTDSASNVISSTVTPSVIARPALTADTSSGAWDQNQTISPLANDVAGNGASLVANSVKLCASGDTAPNCTLISRTITGQGTYTVNSDGTITFDPLPGFTGTATPVTYSVTDSVGQKSSTTITPSVSAPGSPVANPQTKLVSPTGTTAFTTITGSNGLATGTQLSPSQTFLCNVAPNAQTPPNCNATTVTTTDGTWVLSQITGVATYQPNAGTPTGTKTAITYQVSDPAGQSASALLTPVIPPAPMANPDSSSGQQASPQVISLIGNDQPGMPSSPIDVSSVKFCVGNQVAPNCSATSLTVGDQGTYAIDSLGIVTFTPVASFTGTATPITYQVSDSIGQSTSSTLSVYVIPPPAPVANRDLGSAAYGQAIVFEPWKNDSGGAKPAGATQADPQVVPTSIRLCASGQSAPNCAATTITTVDGTYALDTTTGKVTFTPASGFSGTATAPVTYQISNNWTGPSGAATTTAILIPTIAAPGDPHATNDQSATKPETPVILKPMTNDTAGSFALNATTLRLCQETDIAPNCAQLSVTNAHGTYVVDPATGGVTFTPAKGFKGIATIPYVLSDMNARFAHANLFITVSSSSSQPNEQEQESENEPGQGQNQPGQDQLAKTGTNGAYALGSLAIISAMAGTALVASSQRKQTRA